jgi:hypothetical protein
MIHNNIIIIITSDVLALLAEAMLGPWQLRLHCTLHK